MEGGVAFQMRVETDVTREVQAMAVMQRSRKIVHRKYLTLLAASSRKHHAREIKRHVDRPTPFTKKAFLYRAASTKLVSEVYVRPTQAAYLYRLVRPGVRVAERRYVFVPARGQRTNAYGNMPRARRRNALSSGQVFYRPRRGSKLVYLRRGGGTEYLGVMKPTTRYSRVHWDFPRITTRYFRSTFQAKYLQAHDALLQT